MTVTFVDETTGRIVYADPNEDGTLHIKMDDFESVMNHVGFVRQADDARV